MEHFARLYDVGVTKRHLKTVLFTIFVVSLYLLSQFFLHCSVARRLIVFGF